MRKIVITAVISLGLSAAALSMTGCARTIKGANGKTYPSSIPTLDHRGVHHPV